MDPIHIDFTIPDLSLFIGFGLLVFAIVLYLAISKHWEWLQNRPNPLPWLAEHYVAFLLPLGFAAISLAIYFWIWDIRGEIGQIITLLDGQTDPSNIRNLAYAIGALLAAVALSATIPFQLIKVWVNERLAKTTEQGHMTDRITKAVEQLGAEKTVKVHRKNKKGIELYEDDLNGDPDYKKPIITETTEPNLEVRLGAIYALERIAQDSQRDHIPVMEILCAYVRNNSLSISNDQSPRADIQAIISVIGRRTKKRVSYESDETRNLIDRKFYIDFRNTKLRGLDFSFLNFENADFSKADLEYVRFFKTKLKNAYFKDTQLRYAQMSCSDISKTNFSNACLIGATLASTSACGSIYFGAELNKTNFNNADLRKAEFDGADLDGTLFIEADLSASILKHTTSNQFTSFEGTDLNLALVAEADFSEVTTLTQSQINSMFGDQSTELPSNLDRPNWDFRWTHPKQFYEKWQAAKAAANL